MKGSRKTGKKGLINLKEASNLGFNLNNEVKSPLLQVEENSSNREIFPLNNYL